MTNEIAIKNCSFIDCFNDINIIDSKTFFFGHTVLKTLKKENQIISSKESVSNHSKKGVQQKSGIRYGCQFDS